MQYTSWSGDCNWILKDTACNTRLICFWQSDLGTTSFTYEERNELTAIQAPTVNLQYEFSATADNGQILSRTMNGEKVAYQYDTLKRLIAATATVNGATPSHVAHRELGVDFIQLHHLVVRDIGFGQQHVHVARHAPRHRQAIAASSWQFAIPN